MVTVFWVMALFLLRGCVWVVSGLHKARAMPGNGTRFVSCSKCLLLNRKRREIGLRRLCKILNKLKVLLHRIGKPTYVGRPIVPGTRANRGNTANPVEKCAETGLTKRINRATVGPV